jgi:hypothetical protein
LPGPYVTRCATGRQPRRVTLPGACGHGYGDVPSVPRYRSRYASLRGWVRCRAWRVTVAGAGAPAPWPGTSSVPHLMRLDTSGGIPATAAATGSCLLRSLYGLQSLRLRCFLLRDWVRGELLGEQKERMTHVRALICLCVYPCLH